MKMKDQASNIKDVEVIAAARRFHILDCCSLHFAFEKGLVFMVLLSALAGGALAQARTRVYAKVDSDTTIYPGQAFTYSVVVEGGKPSRVDVSAIAQFNPQRAGSGSSIQTVGDRTTISYSENYAIVADKPGTMVLPGVTVVVDGQTYTTNAVEVTVSAPGTTDRLDLEVTLSETKCYVGQPVVMTVRWIVKAQVKDAAFDVPVFKSDDFFIEDLPDAAGAYAKTDATIHGVPVVVYENRELIKGMEAAIVSFRKVLIPKKPGPVTLEPVTVSTSMATGRVRTGDFLNPFRMNYERFAVQSAALPLNVLPLPETGRPKGFYGLVGRYSISASATPTQVSVGDPITLTIRIGGNPYLKPVQWPDLEGVPDLADNFKIPSEKASPLLEDGQKVFTQTLRAGHDRVTEIPAIPLAYFDPDAGDYVVARTQPIPLEVAAAKVLTGADIEGLDAAPVGRQVQALREGFSANYYGPEVLVNQAFSPLAALVSPGYAVLWSVPLAALLGSVAFRLATRTSPEAVARKRRRGACSAAVRRLRAVAAAEANERHDLLIAALRGYVGDRFDRTAGSLTADDCRGIVLTATGDADLADRFRAKISESEASRYASIHAQVDAAQIEEAIELVQRIEENSKR